MGIEDRDWFREASAEKQGMRYNRQNATYRADDGNFPRQLRGSKDIAQSAHISPSRTIHPLIIFLLTVTFCGWVFVILWFIYKFAK